MLIKTVSIDIEKVLNDIWDLFMAEMQASVSTAVDYITLIDFIEDDKAIAKGSINTLNLCGLIDKEELNAMIDKIEAEADSKIEMYKNRVTENKED